MHANTRLMTAKIQTQRRLSKPRLLEIYVGEYSIALTPQKIIALANKRRREYIMVAIVVASKDHNTTKPAMAKIKKEAIEFPCVRKIMKTTTTKDATIATGYR
mmetsp:Transcript_16002/g.20456  ORF Transcript_16002/g.20456 Transcript_16002/m.20456 type:complete len:103 (+) Transcript_16002:135-443(+)